MNTVDIKAEKHRITQRIAERIRTRRLDLGLSQTDVATAMQATFQLIQKYENGSTSIPAWRLEMLCDVLEAPVEYFISDTPLELALPPREYGLIEAWRTMDKPYREMLEEIAYVLAMHGKEV